MSDNPEVEGHMLVFAKKHFPTSYIGTVRSELLVLYW